MGNDKMMIKRLENDFLKIELMPALGGKIRSFYGKKKHFELAAQKKEASEELYGQRSHFAPYAFGMDEAFPNIDAEYIKWKERTIYYPDHGEIWSARFEVAEQSDRSINLYWKSPELNYEYRKTLWLEEDSLYIRYRIKNTGHEMLPCFWTWHGLMRYEEGMEIILPEDTVSCVNVQKGTLLGDVGTVYPLKNNTYDFKRVPEIKSHSTSKFYVAHPVKSGHCGVYYPAENITCTMEYDPEKLPYLGVWVTAGGFQGDFNCALEPSNGFYDSISTAKRNGKLPVLEAGDHMAFEIKITLR